MNKHFIRKIRNIQGNKKDLNRWWRRVVHQYQFIDYSDEKRLVVNGYETGIKISSLRLMKKHLESYLWREGI